ncbi:4-hydroxybenzoate octaprenyltransferase [Colletotrichum truncatum]|uniref:4-hydroxybenzoate octaprenyltransferase n=1 Tax=Colletotrichum truncatum TaxID=5467 RepID=A0ACC3YGV9_COLTU|nr:4-hydroxybenzoate octaprenyltransferase [Colletotrichum truncatum]KAF6784110.1 4-hydroxybenzoate octaprenyltransferase [Colletotrichum truncatum]
MIMDAIHHAVKLCQIALSAKKVQGINYGKPRPTQVTLFWHLVVLSRYNKYTPLFTTFAGVWSALLAGATELANPASTIQPSFVFRQTALCFLSAYLFCGAGMVWNDYVDREIDAKVARTKDRPLAAEKITVVDAMLWMILQLLMSLAVVHKILDGKDVWRHMLPVIAASIVYPYGKRPNARRLRIYPQYILGFTIAWPAILGRASIYGRQEAFDETVSQCIPLCTMVFFWIIYLNTAYSYQDIIDDRKMRVNSFYTVAGRHFHRFLVALVSPILFCLPMYLIRFHSLWLWLSWMGVWTATFVKQLSQFDPKWPASGGGIHKSNFILGIWTIVACTVEVLLNDVQSGLL